MSSIPPHLILLPIVPLLLTAPAAAGDLAGAEALFKKGVAEMAAGQFDTACPALEESHRLDPRPGTLFALAECEAQAGKIATAVARYEDYLRTVSTLSVPLRLRHHDRAKRAAAERDALTPQIPELMLVLPAGAPEGVKVTRDGNELSAPSIGVALPVNPGEHVVLVTTPKGPPLEQRIILEKGDKKRLELKLREAAAKEPAREPQPTAVSPPPLPHLPMKSAAITVTAAPGSARTSDRGRGMRIGGYLVGSVGLAGLAFGGVTGALTLGKKNAIQKNCLGTHCNDEGKAAADSSKTLGLMSTIGFGVGAAGLATGVVLLLSAPRAPKTGRASRWVTAEVFDASPNGALMGVKGAF